MYVLLTTSVVSDHIFFQVPAHWIDALTRNDLTCFEFDHAGERYGFDCFVENFIEGGTIVSVGQSPYFSKHHDARPYGVLPCDVVDVKVVYDYTDSPGV